MWIAFFNLKVETEVLEESHNEVECNSIMERPGSQIELGLSCIYQMHDLRQITINLSV